VVVRDTPRVSHPRRRRRAGASARGPDRAPYPVPGALVSRPRSSSLAAVAYVVAVLFVVRWFGSFLLPAGPPLPVRDGTLGGALLPVWFVLVGRRLAGEGAGAAGARDRSDETGACRAGHVAAARGRSADGCPVQD
jgi:hypothetical protein